jgi:hypothetical protein
MAIGLQESCAASRVDTLADEYRGGVLNGCPKGQNS